LFFDYQAEVTEETFVKEMLKKFERTLEKSELLEAF
jgi:hypothetical protein